MDCRCFQEHTIASTILISGYGCCHCYPQNHPPQPAASDSGWTQVQAFEPWSLGGLTPLNRYMAATRLLPGKLQGNISQCRCVLSGILAARNLGKRILTFPNTSIYFLFKQRIVGDECWVQESVSCVACEWDYKHFTICNVFIPASLLIHTLGGHRFQDGDYFPSALWKYDYISLGHYFP